MKYDSESATDPYWLPFLSVGDLKPYPSGILIFLSHFPKGKPQDTIPDADVAIAIFDMLHIDRIQRDRSASGYAYACR